MPTNQLAPPDMPWLAVRSPPNGLGPPMLNYAAPPDAGGQTQGSALADTGQAAWQWLQDQRAESVRQGLLDPDTGLPTQRGLVDAAGQYAQGVVMGTTAPGDVPPGIVAYHGSPHSFDQFDTSKIGTGEGAQAYGHGLYFAGNEGVARSYRDALATAKTPEEAAAWYLHDSGGDRAAAIAQMSDHAVNGGLGATAAEAQNLRDGLQLLKSGAEITPKAPGHMYEVNIGADPEHFLDWDKPLSEQHPVVQGAVRKTWPDYVAKSDRQEPQDTMTGRELLHHMQTESGTTGYAEGDLRTAGIPGIRYLDQGSRGAGQGTHNYVVFDANTIQVLKKYGLAGLMLGAGGVASQQSGNGQ